MQFKNMFDISVTLLVLSPDKSTEANDVQYENMPDILITLLVLSPDKSTDTRFAFNAKSPVKSVDDEKSPPLPSLIIKSRNCIFSCCFNDLLITKNCAILLGFMYIGIGCNGSAPAEIATSPIKTPSALACIQVPLIEPSKCTVQKSSVLSNTARTGEDCNAGLAVTVC